MSMNPWLVGSTFGVIWEGGSFASGLCPNVMGDCEKIKLAHNLPTAKHKDSGSVSFSSHDAVVACVNDLNNKEIEKEPNFFKNGDVGFVKMILTKHMVVESFSKYPPLGCYEGDKSENLNPKDDENNSSFHSKVGFANEIILLYGIDLGKTIKKLYFDTDKDSMPPHHAGNRFGAHVVAFESWGPQTYNCIMNEGGSTIETLIGGLHHADSVEGFARRGA
ncbi:hypothetical protein SUGI_0701770 [Cryptomeria japonica]|nr:hypothetical protein SUGI_0701770 [Cryptomeria japonica]